MEETKEVWDEYGRLVLASKLEEKSKNERKRGDSSFHHSPEGNASSFQSPPFKRRRRSEEREENPRYSPQIRVHPRNSRYEGDLDARFQSPDSSNGKSRGGFRRNEDYPMNFKQFCETQPEDLKAEELSKRYEDHLEECKRRNLRNFWEGHKEDSWMKEKYLPSKEEAKRIKGIEKAKREAENFDRELNVSFDFEEENKAEKTEQGENNKEKFNVENSLFIRSVPVSRTKSEFQSLFSGMEGFSKLMVTQPIIFRKYSRNIWIFFQTKENAEEAMNKLNKTKVGEFELDLVLNSKENFPFGGTKVAPSSSVEKMSKDLQLAIKLCNSLDSERELESFESFLKEGGDEVKKLDLLIRYLRQVHSFCFYYGGF
eukprot:TRINITY_DN6122_c0_g1_i2.p1 TRINITY_DN6122_c0_g1~~TRINITY_DN6122_c0_g1_i2.p1  ORF type:complete len:371 (-),score=170.99 TRINITY_DN6122_c0_g1_i2:111-1223(-)